MDTNNIADQNYNIFDIKVQDFYSSDKEFTN